jgi:hypothetical protein
MHTFQYYNNLSSGAGFKDYRVYWSQLHVKPPATLLIPIDLLFFWWRVSVPCTKVPHKIPDNSQGVGLGATAHNTLTHANFFLSCVARCGVAWLTTYPRPLIMLALSSLPAESCLFLVTNFKIQLF